MVKKRKKSPFRTNLKVLRTISLKNAKKSITYNMATLSTTVIIEQTKRNQIWLLSQCNRATHKHFLVYNLFKKIATKTGAILVQAYETDVVRRKVCFKLVQMLSRPNGSLRMTLKELKINKTHHHWWKCDIKSVITSKWSVRWQVPALRKLSKVWNMDFFRAITGRLFLFIAVSVSYTFHWTF